MSSELTIKVENVSKCFHVYDTPRDRLKQFILPRLHRFFDDKPKQYFKEFWALNDVSLEIRKGETVGIIGRNGAGKSTLLQIICGTLNQTSGNTEVKGRVAALLELGAGFNPEFSGRENVYMNGSVLGLTRQEIDEKFAEIEAFADIGSFIDQPVKTYSSGMYVRLAFAVQACVDPEILVIDEALSVGDIGFQYKCFQRMEALRKKGVTILMVTHSTGSILEYADRCIVIDAGRVVVDTTDVLSAVLTYEKGMLPVAPKSERDEVDELTSTLFTEADLQQHQLSDTRSDLSEKRFGSARAIIKDLEIVRPDGKLFSDSPMLKCGDEVTFRCHLWSSSEIDNIVLGISISKSQGADVWGDNNLNAGSPITLRAGKQVIEYRAKLPISSGDYLVHCGLARIHDNHREELDQRRPLTRIKFWSTRDQVGVVHAPISISKGERK
jgi:lipopolysaccharide transport system ATP-binding protein